MKRPHGEELNNLNAIANHVMEVFGERGHRVESAIRADDAFDRNHCQSSLTRALVQTAVEEAAAMVSMNRASVPGGALELLYYDWEGYVERRYRLRKAKRKQDGTLYMIASSDSALNPPMPDEPQLVDISQWVLAWIPDHANNMIREIVAAEVVDSIAGNPARLVFGPEVSLGNPTDPFPRGFQPLDEDLDGFDDEEGDDEDYGSTAS